MKKILFLLALITTLNLSAQTAKDFTVTDVHGHEHNLYSYLEGGQYVVLDFFYTTCKPCQFYSPQVNKTYEKYGCNTADVVFIAIDFDDTDEEVKAYDKEYKVPFPSVSGKDGGGNQVCQDYGIRAFPDLMIISPDKQILESVDPPTVVVFDARFKDIGIKEADCATSVSHVPEIAFQLYPNPASSSVGISISGLTNYNARLKLKTLNGQTVVEMNAREEQQLNVQHLTSGVYLVELLLDEGITYHSKLMIQ